MQLDGKWALKDYMDDYPSFERRLAEQEPYWKPGISGFITSRKLVYAMYLEHFGAAKIENFIERKMMKH